MDHLQLVKPWTEFKTELQAFIEEGKSLKNKPVATAEDLEILERVIGDGISRLGYGWKAVLIFPETNT